MYIMKKEKDDDESRRNTLYTLGNVEINEAVLKDESILPMTTKTGDADFDRAFAMVDAWTQSFAKLNPYTADVDYQTYYTQLIGSVANLGSIYKLLRQLWTLQHLILTIRDRKLQECLQMMN